MHAFVTSRVDYCNAVYAMSPQTITNRLQRVINAAARVVSETCKYDCGLKTILHDELQWLDVSERIEYKLGAMVYVTGVCMTRRLGTALITSPHTSL